MKLLVALLVLSVAPLTQAATIPATGLMPGSLATNEYSTATSKYQCYSDVGTSAFARGAVTAAKPYPEAILQFPTLRAQPNNITGHLTGYEYTGLAVLKFSNATSGSISFDANAEVNGETLPAITSFSFSGYSQVATSGGIRVKFVVAIQDCKLPIEGFFRPVPQ